MCFLDSPKSDDFIVIGLSVTAPLLCFRYISLQKRLQTLNPPVSQPLEWLDQRYIIPGSHCLVTSPKHKSSISLIIILLISQFCFLYYHYPYLCLVMFVHSFTENLESSAKFGFLAIASCLQSKVTVYHADTNEHPEKPSNCTAIDQLCTRYIHTLHHRQQSGPRNCFLPALVSPPFLGLIGAEACSPGSFSFPFRRIGLREGGFVSEGKAA